MKRRHKIVGALATVAIVSIGTVGAVCACNTPIFGGGGVSAVQANIFVNSTGSGGSCTRSGSLAFYSSSTSCNSHQEACDATSPDDIIGVEPGTYVSVQIAYSASCTSTSGHPKIWKPDNGIVRYNGTIGSSFNSHAFDIGVSGKASPGPPDYQTFDGGPDLNFRTGLATSGPGTARPGAVHINPYYNTTQVNSRYPTGITLTRWMICYKCANTADGDGELGLYSCQHCTISYSQLGPICCGNTCNPTCESSTTDGPGSPVVVAPQARNLASPESIKGSYLTFVHNTILGETHLPTTFWPTAALGAAPQGTCTGCHTDCAQITLQSHIIWDYNTEYNCQTQINFFDGTGGGWDNGEIIGNLTNTPGGSGGTSFLANGSGHTQFTGDWIVAFNTANTGAAFGWAGSSGIGTATMNFIGNYGPFSYNGNDVGLGDHETCSSFDSAITTLSITSLYNVVTNGVTGCGTSHDVVTCSPGYSCSTALNVVHLADWTASPPDNTVDYHLASSATVADNVVPQATCASVITIAQSINGSYSQADDADLDGTARTGSTCDAGADEK